MTATSLPIPASSSFQLPLPVDKIDPYSLLRAGSGFAGVEVEQRQDSSSIQDAGPPWSRLV